MTAKPSIRYSESLRLIGWHADQAATIAENLNPKFPGPELRRQEKKLADHFERIGIFMETLSEALEAAAAEARDA